ncbi:MAG TPA: EAL domain-containing protein [Burkholderiales bacterium]|nr:EAL domain-containing protein [Burkholderiales bacterium]
MNFSPRRWRALYLLVPLLVIVASLLVLVEASMETLSAGRAYVAGEGLWSKAQKDAVHHLLYYARSFDERYWQRYQQSIAVPLGDRKAREALERAEPDYAAARAGFIEGRNHPDDVDSMARLFVRFRQVNYVSKAIAIWTEGDQRIAELRAIAARLHGEIQGARDPRRIGALLDDLHTVNTVLEPLEDSFSFTLGEASRWMRQVLFYVTLGAAALLVLAAALGTRALLRRADLAESGRRESEERLLLMANSVPALIAYLDREQRFRFSNRTYGEWFGIPHEQMVGRTLREVSGDKVYEELRPRVERVLSGQPVEFEYSLGEGQSARRLQVAYAPHLDPSGEVIGFYELASDVTALNRAQQDQREATRELAAAAARLEFLAHHDSLTELPNRVMLQERLRQAVSLARRHHKQLALLFVDLDHFKNVNDSLGHGVGDDLLQLVAGRLRECVRQEDMVARLGGDEFCIVLQDLNEPREASTVAQKLLTELAEPYRVGEHDLYVAASIGIACLPNDGHDMETLLKNADIAMYRAKNQGRGNFQFYSPAENRGAMSAVAMTSSLRHALAHGEFELHYQPRVDVPSGRIVAVEALLRWNHPEQGLLMPDLFVPFAEDNGLIVPIGEWVLREACAQARRWTESGWGRIAVGVNLSMRQLRNPELIDQVRAALEGNALPPWRLELEITESMAMQAPEHTQRAMRAFADLGARIALDDFGTGHSALHYLKRFPVNVLKIDKAFVNGLPGDRHDAAIARAVVDLARGLDLEVVAEGVRLPAQRDFLLGVGCRLCQGDLFGGPVSALEMEKRFHGGLAAA